MNNKFVSAFGFIGVSLLLFTFILGGLLIENYNITSQFISEFKGLYQRAIEMLFIIWTILSSIEINKASILKQS